MNIGWPKKQRYMHTNAQVVANLMYKIGRVAHDSAEEVKNLS